MKLFVFSLNYQLPTASPAPPYLYLCNILLSSQYYNSEFYLLHRP